MRFCAYLIALALPALAFADEGTLCSEARRASCAPASEAVTSSAVSTSCAYDCCRDRARYFTAASSQYLTVADNATLSLGADSPFTWAGWFYVVNNASSRYLFGKGGGGGWPNNVAYACQLKATGEMRCQIGNTVASVQPETVGAPSVDNWHFFALRHDPDNNLMRLRVDDTDITPVAWAGGTHDEAKAFAIGRFSETAGNGWNGGAGHLAFWKAHLTDAQVSFLRKGQLYEGLPEGFPGPTEWFALEESSGDATGKVTGMVLTDTAGVTSMLGPGVCR